jgi:transposase InsO family protein
MWQSDSTHWQMSDGTECEIIGWLDDHSRYLLHLSAHHRVTGKTVTDTFTAAASGYGYPTSTLTDDGMVYTEPPWVSFRSLSRGLGYARGVSASVQGPCSAHGYGPPRGR